MVPPSATRGCHDGVGIEERIPRAKRSELDRAYRCRGRARCLQLVIGSGPDTFPDEDREPDACADGVHFGDADSAAAPPISDADPVT